MVSCFDLERVVIGCSVEGIEVGGIPIAVAAAASVAAVLLIAEDVVVGWVIADVAGVEGGLITGALRAAALRLCTKLRQ